MNHIKCEAFWEQSWKTIDPIRVSSYIQGFDTTQDAIINFLKTRKVTHVCDAGCGCGAYSFQLAQQGFTVSGFDMAENAVLLTKKLLLERGFSAENFKQANILATGYPDSCFDAVVARDVVDHLPIKQGIRAIEELLRIVRPGGYVLLTLDAADDEYEAEPHEINEDGDYIFCRGKWDGMVFHPYSRSEAAKLTAGRDSKLLQNRKEIIVMIEKQTQGKKCCVKPEMIDV